MAARLALRGVLAREAMRNRRVGFQPHAREMQVLAGRTDDDGIAAHRLDAIHPVRNR
jgi:hypothetical protein